MTELQSPAGTTGTATRPGRPRAGGRDRVRRPGPVARVRRFFREVVAELRKVIYPSRSELITYVTVVVFFVAGMVAIVAGLDYVFTKAVLAIFG